MAGASIFQKLGNFNTLATTVKVLLDYGWPFFGSALASYLTFVTGIFAVYAPISYFLTFSGFLLIFSAVRWLWHKANHDRAVSRYLDLLSAPKSKINPLQRVFSDQRIFLQDLYLPHDHLIKDKVFENCDLVGPMNLVLIGQVHVNGAILMGAIL